MISSLVFWSVPTSSIFLLDSLWLTSSFGLSAILGVSLIVLALFIIFLNENEEEITSIFSVSGISFSIVFFVADSDSIDFFETGSLALFSVSTIVFFLIYYKIVIMPILHEDVYFCLLYNLNQIYFQYLMLCTKSQYYILKLVPYIYL